MKKIVILAILAAAVSLSACEKESINPKDSGSGSGNPIDGLPSRPR